MALILMVNDEVPDRRYVSQALDGEGYRMISIDDPSLIWAYINRFEPDLVLLNGLSERFQSFDVLNDIKRKYPDFPVLVYMVTDDDSMNKLKQAIALALFEVRFGRRRRGNRRLPSVRTVEARQLRTSV